MYNFSQIKDKVNNTTKWLTHELSALRTGRATPALLDSVLVESYGSRMPISHVANVGIEDARSLKITPWDKGQIKDIEKAITAANLGVSTSPDSDGVRVIFPELTEERRKTIMKIVNDKFEDARVAIRLERDVVWGDIQQRSKDGEIPEDDKFRYKDELQKIIDDSNGALEDIVAKKEKEITS